MKLKKREGKFDGNVYGELQKKIERKFYGELKKKREGKF